MGSDPNSTDSKLLAVHALRDLEESERSRQLGGLLVHDLNNVLFALLGRVQLLQRRAKDPEVTKAAAEILETARAIESQVKVLYAACRRDEPTVERSNAREAVTAALRECVAGLASAIRPIDLDGALAAISLDASFEGDADQIAVAIRQAMSIHRGRARGPIGVEVTMTTGDDAHVQICLHDDGGPADQLPAIPSLLNGKFDLTGLPLAAAHRSMRDFGGSIACTQDARGLCTTLRFDVRRGITVARFDATGAQKSAQPSFDVTTHDHASTRNSAPPPRRVLIADDDVAVRAVLVAALEAIGDDVDTIADPGACDTHPELPDFDVMILDAGGGGIEALARLRARGVDLPVLLASGDDLAPSLDPLTQTISKPFPLNRLDRVLASLAALKPRA